MEDKLPNLIGEITKLRINVYPTDSVRLVILQTVGGG